MDVVTLRVARPLNLCPSLLHLTSALRPCEHTGMGGLAQHLNGLNLLHQPGAVPTSAGHVAAPSAAQDAGTGWLPNGAAADNIMFYQNGMDRGASGAWADPRSATALM